MRYVIRVAPMVALLALSTSLFAADLPTPVYKANVSVPAVWATPRWSGLYWGITTGYGAGRSQFDVGGVGSPKFGFDGGLLGATLGYNYQTGRAVFGWESDLAFSLMHGANDASAPCPACRVDVHWLGTTRARVGVAFDPVLPYLTGGAAYGRVRVEDALGGFNSKTDWGWSAGAGVEIAMRSVWSMKFEYLYVDLGKINMGLPADVSFRSNIGRFGLNAKF